MDQLLFAALTKYGDHLYDCPVRGVVPNTRFFQAGVPMAGCSCGFNTAMAVARAITGNALARDIRDISSEAIEAASRWANVLALIETGLRPPAQVTP